MKKINLLFLSITLLLIINSQLFAQWEVIEFSGEYQIRDLFTVDNNLFVIGDSDPDKIFLSSNNGNTFTTLSLPDPVTSIYCVEGHNGAIFAGTNEGIYVSSDLGASWVQKNNGLENSETVRSLRSTNNYIYAGGYYSRIYRSADNGETWTLLGNSQDSSDRVEQIEVSDSLICLFVNRYPGNDRIFSSTDNGSTWISKFSTNDIRDFYLSSTGSTIIVVKSAVTSGGSGVIYSTDYGNNFLEDQNFDQANVGSIHSSDETFFIGNLVSIFDDGIIFRNSSTDNDWVSKSDGLYSNIIRDIKNTNTYLFVTHNADSVISRRPLSDFGITTDVKDDEVTPTNFVLNQNYPNPFNPSTTISYSIPEASQVSLKVFDTLGREVAELVNSEKAAGNYELNFDASQLSSGIYFYILSTNNYLSTKKMLLIK